MMRLVPLHLRHPVRFRVSCFRRGIVLRLTTDGEVEEDGGRWCGEIAGASLLYATVGEYVTINARVGTGAEPSAHLAHLRLGGSDE